MTAYSYVKRGNILSKTKVYDDVTLPAETTSFSYSNSAWQDELTSVNGTNLTYDANGNVLSYGNMEFEWTNGRVLSQITVNPTDPNGTADVYRYTYDESGIWSAVKNDQCFYASIWVVKGRLVNIVAK